jgi:hypothetical protein
MKRILLFFSLFCCTANASHELGLDWFSVVAFDGEPPELQISHVMLGNGSKKADIELNGCATNSLKFELVEWGFSTFKLPRDLKCGDNAKLKLYFDGQYIKEYAPEISSSMSYRSSVTVIDGKRVRFIVNGILQSTGELNLNIDNSSSSISYNLILGHDFVYEFQ